FQDSFMTSGRSGLRSLRPATDASHDGADRAPSQGDASRISNNTILFDKGVARMTKEIPTIKNALIVRLVAAKLAAIKAAGGDADSRRICTGCVPGPSRQILTATVE